MHQFTQTFSQMDLFDALMIPHWVSVDLGVMATKEGLPRNGTSPRVIFLIISVFINFYQNSAGNDVDKKT